MKTTHMPQNLHLRTLALALFLLAGCSAGAGRTATVRVPADATPVDLLLLRGEYRGLVPGTDMHRVKARVPEFLAMATGVGEAGLLYSEDEGVGMTTERSGGRLQAVWYEFAGSPRIPATGLATADGRIAAGATELDVRAWLKDHGLPVLVREIPVPEGETVREYYIDAGRSFLTVIGGHLSKATAADRHLYSAGRAEAD